MLNFPDPAPAPERLLLLGRGGFLARALETAGQNAGLDCLAVGRPEHDLTSSAIVEGLSRCIRPEDTVIFLSALTPEHGKGADTFQKNLRMVVHFCEWLEGGGRCKHLLYVSSDAVYPMQEAPLDETVRPDPADLYGLMHLTRERLLKYSCQQADIPFAILRPCALYGPGDTHGAYGPNRFCKSAREEGVITLFGEGADVRDHLYVEDAARLILAAARRQASGVVNLVSGQAVSFAEVAARVAEAAGRPVDIEQLPQRQAPSRRTFDTSVRDTLEADFQPTPLAEGLRKLLLA